MYSGNLWVIFKVMIHLVLILSITSFGNCSRVSNEARLVNDLLKNYNPSVKPTVNFTSPVTVRVSFVLGRIEGLNEKNQVLTTFGWISTVWKDELLQWNPALYNGTYRFTIPGKNIWLPEIALVNSVTQGNDLAFEAKFRAVVYADGTVTWGPGFKWETSCSLKLTYFPFDVHTCKVEFINWMYGGDLLMLIPVENSMVDVSIMEPNSEWTLLNTSVGHYVQVFETGDGNFKLPRVWFTVTLKRNPTFYLWNIVIPSFMMTFMAVMVNILPCESGEKVGLAVTVLLGFSVILLMVSDITPSGGDELPYISQYIVYSMAVTAVCLFTTILVINLHHHNPRKPVPPILKILIFKVMATLVCRRHPRSSNVKPLKNSAKRTAWGTESQEKRIIRQLNELDSQTENSLSAILPDDIIAFLRKKKDDDAEEEMISRNRDDWEYAAKVVDRFLLIFYLIGITSMTFGFLSAMLDGQNG